MTQEKYLQLEAKKTNSGDVVAIYYNGNMDQLTYQLVTIGSMSSIQRYLPTSNGKALPMKLGKQPLWVMLDGESDSALFFRKTDDARPYTDIREEDIEIVKYIISMM